MMKKPALLATLSMVGTIVGAGIFGVPYVFAQAGVPIGLIYCAVLGATAVLSHWMYAEIAAATAGKHRLVGYVKKHLGRFGAVIVSVTNPLGMLGTLLAYIILGGSFLSVLLGGSTVAWSLAFFAIMALLLIPPFRKLVYLEGWLTWLLIAAALAIVAVVAPHIRLENLVAGNIAKWFLPFGIIFFSFGGVSAVPDVVESLKKDIKKARYPIAAGTIISVAVTALFGLAIAGACGSGTSQNAVGGLVSIVGKWIVAGGAVFGLLAIATSFITIGSNVKEQFQFDFRLSRRAAWAASVGLPLAVYLLGARDFIGVIGFVGAIFAVIDGMLIALMARRLVKGGLRAMTIPLMVVFAIGIISEIISLSR